MNQNHVIGGWLAQLLLEARRQASAVAATAGKPVTRAVSPAPCP